MPSIGFIGAGTVGTALAVRLREKGYPVKAVSSRTAASARRLAGKVKGCRVYDNPQSLAEAVDIVFITTSDDAIGRVASHIKWSRGKSVIHCSGADSLGILDPVTAAGAQAGGFHPLQTFASITQAIENIPGTTFALEADDPLLGTLKEMAGALDGQWIKLNQGDKVFYHAAAVFASNYLVTLVKLSTDLWQTFGISAPEATRALLPLLKGTLNNLENVGLPNCLTGPIARGDLGTVMKHLSALESGAPALLPAYQEMGRQTIPVALAKGKINEDRAEELRSLLGNQSGLNAIPV